MSCSGSEPAGGSSTESPISDSTVGEGGLLGSDAAVDPRAAELAAIRGGNDGKLPVADALDLFASVFGEIPDGDPNRFDVREGDGTMALGEVGAHWDELTADQQQAIQGLLGYSSNKSSLLSPAAAPGDPALQADVDAARAAIAAQVGADVSFPIVGQLVPGLMGRPPGETAPVEVGGLAIGERGGELPFTGVPDRCLVQFNPEYSLTAALVAHEVFHCFQYALGLENWYGAQAWLLEGMAEWAGNEIGGIDAGGTRNFQDWALSDGSLYAMSYEAIGHYWVLESLGASPWLQRDEMLQAGGGVEAVAATGLDPAAVISRTATSLARAGSVAPLPVSDVWDFGISDVPDYAFRLGYAVTPTAPYEYERNHAAFSRYELPELRLDGGNRVQVSLAADVGVLEFFGQEPIEWQNSLVREFCLEEAGCACSADGTIGELPPGARELILTGGSLDGGSIKFQVRLPEIAFTDGGWRGTITSTDLSISSDTGSGARPQTESAIEFTIEGGVVTSGSYALTFPGSFDSPLGMIDGTVSISGAVTGCGYSPELVPATVVIDATMQFPTGDSGPVQVAIDIGAETMTIGVPVGPPASVPFETGGDFETYGSMWVLQPGSTSTNRQGHLDATSELAFMAAAGFAVTEPAFFFDISRV